MGASALGKLPLAIYPHKLCQARLSFVKDLEACSKMRATFKNTGPHQSMLITNNGSGLPDVISELVTACSF